MTPRKIDKNYDVIVIGGGINGAAIANMSSGLGYKTLLLEKNDFASGTSSKSTKLLHGGIRYLEQWDIGLVKEALSERYALWKELPQLTKPVRFIIPVYQHDKRPLWQCKLGVRFYDWLAGKQKVGDVESFSAEETLKLISGLNPVGLKGSVAYCDIQMDDAGIVMANIQQAMIQGADVRSFFGVGSFIKENEKAVGVIGVDTRHYQEYRIYAKHIISAVGPWSNKMLAIDEGVPVQRIRPTKGVHIIYQDRLCDDAVFVQSAKDKRIFFIIPWGQHSLIGTTDTDYSGDPDEVSVDEDDVWYLLSQTQRVFSEREISEERILTTFVGLRPLVSGSGDPSSISRHHVIEQSDSQVWYVMGGKYTTFRLIARDCLQKVLAREINYDWQFVQ